MRLLLRRAIDMVLLLVVHGSMMRVILWIHWLRIVERSWSRQLWQLLIRWRWLKVSLRCYWLEVDR